MDIKMKPYLLLFATYLICVAQTFAQNQEIRLFSHRGGRLEHDENTLRAFEASYRAGYRGFETDVRMTRDGASNTPASEPKRAISACASRFVSCRAKAW